MDRHMVTCFRALSLNCFAVLSVCRVGCVIWIFPLFPHGIHRPMTSANHTSTWSYNFQSVIERALGDYTKQTGIDLAKYDSAKQIERCNSPDDILWLLREKARGFREYREKDRELINWIT